MRSQTTHPSVARWNSHQRKMRAWLWEKKSGPCMDCGQSFHPVCMDFDHRERRDKGEPTVSALVSHSSAQERILAEIEKCDLVCANCHRLRTFNQKRWKREAPTNGNFPRESVNGLL